MSRKHTKVVQCSDKEFRCLDGQQCVPEEYRCDSHNDCQDESDESNCSGDSESALSHLESRVVHGEFICQNGPSIPKEWVCDYKLDCPMGDDESIGASTASNCSFNTSLSTASSNRWFTCPEATIPCNPISTVLPRQCISPDRLCDGVYDCPDFMDELVNCVDQCDNQTEFACRLSPANSPPICITKEAVCDGKVDCPVGDDESEGPRSGCTTPDCAVQNGYCSQLCSPSSSGVLCSCLPGYIKPSDESRSCVAIGDLTVLYVENGELFQRSAGSDSITHFRLHAKLDDAEAPVSHTSALWSSFDATKQNSPMNQSRNWFFIITDFDYSLKISHHRNRLSILFVIHAARWSFVLKASPEEKQASQFLSPLYILQPLLLLSAPTAITPVIPSLSIAYDWVHELMYVANNSSRTIEVMSVIHGWHKTLTTFPSSDQPVSVAVDPRFGRVYWINGGRRPQIEVIDADGKHRRSLVQLNLSFPSCLMLDLVTNELFWADSGRGAVEAYNLRTKHKRIVIQSDAFHPMWIAVFEDWVYWTDRKQNRLMRANKFNGKYVQSLFQITNPSSFRLQHELLRPPLINRCRNHMCEQLCLPIPLRSYPAYSLPYTCTCANGWEVNHTDAQRCVVLANETGSESLLRSVRHLSLKSLLSNVTSRPLPRKTEISKHTLLLIMLVGICLASVMTIGCGYYVHHKIVHHESVELAFVPSTNMKSRYEPHVVCSAPDDQHMRQPMLQER